eukprot:MONOS_11255.1-p1 / transcript=MONOS_11255.1 / gene=MONOS_11255 / organism=Monocercomonoides_exilis_PA203 / gene_product=unspecified product / transcript_product=unspecified product / location=Mono_scaffold00554:30951-35513(-) / protein_length=1288 / sequence_SO=supercontig / SO=protein_coding / is_pseudo=false
MKKASRVDSVYHDAFKIVGGLNAAGPLNPETFEEIKGKTKHETTRMKTVASSQATLETSVDEINVKKWDQNFLVDPIIWRATREGEEGTLSTSLIVNLESGVCGKMLFDVSSYQGREEPERWYNGMYVDGADWKEMMKEDRKAIEEEEKAEIKSIQTEDEPMWICEVPSIDLSGFETENMQKQILPSKLDGAEQKRETMQTNAMDIEEENRQNDEKSIQTFKEEMGAVSISSERAYERTEHSGMDAVKPVEVSEGFCDDGDDSGLLMDIDDDWQPASAEDGSDATAAAPSAGVSGEQKEGEERGREIKIVNVVNVIGDAADAGMDEEDDAMQSATQIVTDALSVFNRPTTPGALFNAEMGKSDSSSTIESPSQSSSGLPQAEETGMFQMESQFVTPTIRLTPLSEAATPKLFESAVDTPAGRGVMRTPSHKYSKKMTAEMDAMMEKALMEATGNEDTLMTLDYMNGGQIAARRAAAAKRRMMKEGEEEEEEEKEKEKESKKKKKKGKKGEGESGEEEEEEEVKESEKKKKSSRKKGVLDFSRPIVLASGKVVPNGKDKEKDKDKAARGCITSLSFSSSVSDFQFLAECPFPPLKTAHDATLTRTTISKLHTHTAVSVPRDMHFTLNSITSLSLFPRNPTFGATSTTSSSSPFAFTFAPPLRGRPSLLPSLPPEAAIRFAELRALLSNFDSDAVAMPPLLTHTRSEVASVLGAEGASLLGWDLQNGSDISPFALALHGASLSRTQTQQFSEDMQEHSKSAAGMQGASSSLSLSSSAAPSASTSPALSMDVDGIEGRGVADVLHDPLAVGLLHLENGMGTRALSPIEQIGEEDLGMSSDMKEKVNELQMNAEQQLLQSVLNAQLGGDATLAEHHKAEETRTDGLNEDGNRNDGSGADGSNNGEDGSQGFGEENRNDDNGDDYDGYGFDGGMDADADSEGEEDKMGSGGSMRSTNRLNQFRLLYDAPQQSDAIVTITNLPAFTAFDIYEEEAAAMQQQGQTSASGSASGIKEDQIFPALTKPLTTQFSVFKVEDVQLDEALAASNTTADSLMDEKKFDAKEESNLSLVQAETISISTLGVAQRRQRRLVPRPPMVRAIVIHFDSVPKRVDMHRLKRGMWKELKKDIVAKKTQWKMYNQQTAEANKKLKMEENAASDGMEQEQKREESETSEQNKPEVLSSDNQAEVVPVEKPKLVHSFRASLSTLSSVLPPSQLKETSVHLAFLCLLHMANDHNLVLTEQSNGSAVAESSEQNEGEEKRSDILINDEEEGEFLNTLKVSTRSRREKRIQWG